MAVEVVVAEVAVALAASAVNPVVVQAPEASAEAAAADGASPVDCRPKGGRWECPVPNPDRDLMQTCPSVRLSGCRDRLARLGGEVATAQKAGEDALAPVGLVDARHDARLYLAGGNLAEEGDHRRLSAC